MFRGDASHSGVYPAADGRSLAGMQWRFPTGGEVNGSPAIAGRTVYAGSGDGRLYAIDLASRPAKIVCATNRQAATPATPSQETTMSAGRGSTRARERMAVSTARF